MKNSKTPSLRGLDGDRRDMATPIPVCHQFKLTRRFQNLCNNLPTLSRKVTFFYRQIIIVSNEVLKARIINYICIHMDKDCIQRLIGSVAPKQPSREIAGNSSSGRIIIQPKQKVTPTTRSASLIRFGKQASKLRFNSQLT